MINVPYGRGSLKWSETFYFHKGGPLQMVPKFYGVKSFKNLYLGSFDDEDEED